MPGCYGGIYGELDQCSCPTKIELRRKARERQARIDAMKALIEVYPVAAREAVAELESRPLWPT